MVFYNTQEKKYFTIQIKGKAAYEEVCLKLNGIQKHIKKSYEIKAHNRATKFIHHVDNAGEYSINAVLRAIANAGTEVYKNGERVQP